MSELTLPSGIRVELRDELNWGQMLHVIDFYDKGAEAFSNAKCAAIVVSHDVEAIAKFNVGDALALMNTVNRIYLSQGRPPGEDLPLGNGSRRSRTGSRPKASILRALRA